MEDNEAAYYEPTKQIDQNKLQKEILTTAQLLSVGVDEAKSIGETDNTDTNSGVSDLRIRWIERLRSPQDLHLKIPLKTEHAQLVMQTRREVEKIICGDSLKFMVIVGPCSIHDHAAAVEYARRLSFLQKQYRDEMLILMRVYFEKPRTTIGWKGYIYDPYLDGSHRISEGLEMSRQLLREITELGVGIACEFLDTITPQYLSDFVSWGAIGARTVESQIHRQLASGLSMPIGFKNGTSGSIRVAVDAMLSAKHAHVFCGTDMNGCCSVVHTKGNPFTHVVLRGTKDGPNYSKESIEDVQRMLLGERLATAVLVDCSHDNSGKNYKNQKTVLADVLETFLKSEGNKMVLGVMIESNLVEGRQTIGQNMTFGQSVTDGCVGWIETLVFIKMISAAVRKKYDF